MRRRGLGLRGPGGGVPGVACGGVLALLWAVLVAGCTVSGGPPAADLDSAALSPAASVPAATAKAAKVAKVAILVPLSSQGAPGVIARSLKQAAELAVFERETPSLELMVKDDKGTPAGAKAAAAEAVESGAKLILGPLYSKSVAAVAPVARKAGVPVVAFSSDRKVAGNGVFLLSFQPEPEVQRVVAFAAGQGKLRYAALIPRDNFGRLVEPVFRDAVARAGGTVVTLETYPTNANALLSPMRKLSTAIAEAEARAEPIDVLFMPGGQEYLEMLARLLPPSKIDTGKFQVIGTGGMDYPNAGRDASLVGAWYPGPDPRGWSEFAQKYAKTYEAAPPRIAGFAYDAMTLAIALATESSGQGFDTAALTRAGGFSGIDGVYRLLPDGTTDRTFAILEVQKFGSTVIEPAPSLDTPAATAGGFSLFKVFQ